MTPEEQAAADAAAAQAAQQAPEQEPEQQPAEQTQVPAAPTNINGQTPEQIQASLARLAELEAAETQRASEAEAARLQSLSDVERESARAATAETERETARAALEAEVTAANTLRLRIAAQEAARALGYNLHPSALEDALALGDFAAIEFNDAREPQGVSEALKALVARKPYLVARAETVNLGGQEAGRDEGADEPTRQRASALLTRGF